MRCSEVQILSFRERRCAFSLDFWPIRPSVLDGVRSKVVLRVDTDLVEFRQLKEVGSFPTCVILWLRAM